MHSGSNATYCFRAFGESVELTRRAEERSLCPQSKACNDAARRARGQREIARKLREANLVIELLTHCEAEMRKWSADAILRGDSMACRAVTPAGEWPSSCVGVGT